MSGKTVNFLLDCWLLGTFAFLLWLTLLQQFVFPDAPAARGHALWRLDYDAWSDVRFATTVVLAASVLLHLVLHWTWVCGFVAGQIGRLTGRRVLSNSAVNTLYGVATLIGLLTLGGLALFMAELGVSSPGTGQSARARESTTHAETSALSERGGRDGG